MDGRISSFQSMGTLDGPGIRCVVFIQGCPLRCAYCHNPETWSADGGFSCTVGELADRVERMRSYIFKRGGVTLSGGEPLMQPDFAAGLLAEFKARGFHTALDTSGMTDEASAAKVLKYTDLVICDLKFDDEANFKKYCGGRLSQVWNFIRLTERMNIPLWLRRVIVPGINDGAESVIHLKDAAAGLSNLKKIELLPFRKLCLEKYRRLGIPFPLEDTPECGAKKIEELRISANL